MGHNLPLLPQLCILSSALLVSSLLPLTSATLLLGQIVTGSGYNKAIEIRNSGLFSEAANLTDFGLLWLPNGQNFRVAGWLQLQAPISTQPALVPGGGSYVIAHSRAAPWLVGNASALNEAFLFDGDDVLALAMRAGNNTWLPVDIVGDPDHYNPSGWPIAGTANATRNHTLVRKANITSPTVNWTLSAGADAASSQWLVLPSSVFVAGVSNSPGSDPLTSGQCDNGVGGVSDRRVDKSALRIATWTVDWLFDGVNDPVGSPWNNGTICPGNPGDPGVVSLNQCNAAGAQARNQRVASRIKALNVDILSLVEVENCGVLQQLVTGSDPIRYASYLGLSNGSASPFNLGLLSRLDPIAPVNRILGERSYPLPGSLCGFNGTGTTDVAANFLVTFKVFNLMVTFVGLEFSGYPLDPESCAVREAQAALISEEVQRQIAAGREVLLAGNLNDWSSIDQDPLGHVPISRVLQTLQYSNASGPPQLVSASTWLPNADRYTSDGAAVAGGSPTPQQVDYILLTQGLASLNVTVQIVHDYATLQSLSSHWPLVLTLQSPTGNTVTAAPVVQTQPNAAVTVSSTTVGRHNRSSLVLPIALGTAGGAIVMSALVVLCLVLRRRKRVYSHKRLEKPLRLRDSGQLSRTETDQTCESIEEQDSMVQAVDKGKDSDDWRPIDRSMPTIKSGEILELGLYAKSPFADNG